MHRSPESLVLTEPTGLAPELAAQPKWQRVGLIVFACVNAGSLGIFFAVFVGVVIAPPNPRSLTFMLVAGAFALSVLVLGQLVYWSALALRQFKERQS